MLFATRGQLFPQRSILSYQFFQLHLRFRGDSRRRDIRFLFQKRTIEGTLFVVFPITVCYEIKKDIEVFQTQRRLFFRDLPSLVCGSVSDLPYVVHPIKKIFIHKLAEFIGIHQSAKRILVRYDQKSVYGIHPFDSAFHRPATVQHTGRRVDLIDTFRGCGWFCKGCEFGFFCEEVKIGHLSLS